MVANNSQKFFHAQYLNAMGIQTWVRRHLPSAEESSSVNEFTTTLSNSTHPIDESFPVNEPTTTLSNLNYADKETHSVNSDEFQTAHVIQTSQPATIQMTSSSPEASPEDSPVHELDWEFLQQRIAACTACELHKTRTQTVFGVGNRQAELLLVGEAPGADEDAQGEPFVGRAGQLLNAMLYAIDLKREDVFIANVIKCRPPENRNPQPVEMACCNAFLQRQIVLINPKLIVAVGRVAAHHLLTTTTAIGKLRGQRFEYGDSKIPLIATYHPAYLLRRLTEKRQSWYDLQFIRQTLIELQK